MAEKFASLDKKAEKQDRERQALFQKSLDTVIRDFEKAVARTGATIQDRSSV